MEPSLATNEGRRPRLIESVWVRSALVVVIAEAALIVAGIIPRWTAVLVAAAVLVGYFARGRAVTSPQLRQALWAAALSQAVVLFVPLALWIIGALVVVAIAAVAAAVLVVLIVDR